MPQGPEPFPKAAIAKTRTLPDSKDMLGLEGYDTSSEESENERMTPNMCETQAAKRTKCL